MPTLAWRPHHRLMAGGPVEAWQVQGSVPLRFTYENASGLYAEL